MDRWKIVFLLGLFYSFSTSAFTLNITDENLRGWDTDTISFKVNYDNCSISESALNSAIDSAVNLWNGVSSGGVKVERGERSTLSVSEIASSSRTDGPFIACDSALGTTLGIDTSNIPGVALIYSTSSTISHGYLLLNATSGEAADISGLSETTLAVVVAHEIGHVLGLGHSSDTSALMYYSASAKEELNLSQDDVDGFSYLYPRQEIGSDGVMGCGQIRDDGNDDPGLGGAGMLGVPTKAVEWALLLILMALVTRGFRNGTRTVFYQKCGTV